MREKTVCVIYYGTLEVHLSGLLASFQSPITVYGETSRISAVSRGWQARVAHSSAVNLDECADVSSGRGNELIAVDDAVTASGQIDARKARVIELRFFGGLSVEGM